MDALLGVIWNWTSWLVDIIGPGFLFMPFIGLMTLFARRPRILAWLFSSPRPRRSWIADAFDDDRRRAAANFDQLRDSDREFAEAMTVGHPTRRHWGLDINDR